MERFRNRKPVSPAEAESRRRGRIKASFSGNGPGESARMLALNNENAAGRNLDINRWLTESIQPALISSGVSIEIGAGRAIGLDHQEIVSGARANAGVKPSGRVSGIEIETFQRDAAETFECAY